MCGIVGILGREPVAVQLVDALKRLEYRGYDSAGVATLEDGRLTRRRAEGKLRNLETKLQSDPLKGTIGIGHTRWATHGRPSESNAHPHATDRLGGRAQRHHRELPRAARGAREGRREIRLRDRHRSRRPSGDPRNEERPLAGRRGGGGAAAAARRVRARVPVRGRREPADRRAQGLAARDRLRRRRDVSRLRRHRARAVHRHGGLSRGRRLGGDLAHQRRDPRRRRLARRARDAQGAAVVVPGRQGQPSPFHGEGNPRAAGGRRPHAGALSRHGGGARRAAGDAAVRFQEARPDFDLGLRHRLLRRAGRQILVRALRAAAGRDRRCVRIPLPRSAAERQRSRHLRLAVRRDRRHAGDAALRQGAQAARALGGQRAELDHRARERRRAADAGRPGDRRRLDQGVHLPARGACLPCDRGRACARRAVGGRRTQAGARADRGAAPDGGGAQARAA